MYDYALYIYIYKIMLLLRQEYIRRRKKSIEKKNFSGTNHFRENQVKKKKKIKTFLCDMYVYVIFDVSRLHIL